MPTTLLDSKEDVSLTRVQSGVSLPLSQLQTNRTSSGHTKTLLHLNMFSTD